MNLPYRIVHVHVNYRNASEVFSSFEQLRYTSLVFNISTLGNSHVHHEVVIWKLNLKCLSTSTSVYLKVKTSYLNYGPWSKFFLCYCNGFGKFQLHSHYLELAAKHKVSDYQSAWGLYHLWSFFLGTIQSLQWPELSPVHQVFHTRPFSMPLNRCMGQKSTIAWPPSEIIRLLPDQRVPTSCRTMPTRALLPPSNFYPSFYLFRTFLLLHVSFNDLYGPDIPCLCSPSVFLLSFPKELS